MDSGIRKDLHKAAQKLGASSRVDRPRSQTKKILLIGVGISIVSLCAVMYGLRYEVKQSTHSPIPASISQATPFSIFYPESTQLPKGYIFDTASLSASSQAIVYSVTYGQGKKIAFTLQKKPSENELKTFHANQIPLRNEVNVPIGTASIGVLNNQTLASLPTDKNSWLIITAPQDINQDDLRQVLKALRSE